VKRAEGKDPLRPKRKEGQGCLYLGTTEKIAKSAPVAGLTPDKELLYLTDVYPGHFAFYASTSGSDRYAIVEVDATLLDPEAYLPCEWYLEQKSRKHGKTPSERNRILAGLRRNLEDYHGRWKESLKEIGVCVYTDPISKKAIRRIAIYDPAFNPVITEAIAGTRLSVKEHKANYRRHRALTRWLMGEEVTIEEWIGKGADQMDKKEKESLAEALQSKWGLDMFYHGPVKIG
jgi:hypothetical protein